MLNYFGQGALLLHEPGGGEQPVLRLVPELGALPDGGLATAAAIVASQALISGAFSLTRQAVQLGYCPRVTIVHTSQHGDRADLHPGGELGADGRLPRRWCSASRARPTWRRPTASRSPARWSITTLLFHTVARDRWGWPLLAGARADGAVPAASTSPSSAPTSSRSRQGGWFPLAVGARRLHADDDLEAGPARLAGDRAREHAAHGPVPRRRRRAGSRPGCPGTAVFMTSDTGGAPPVLLHHLKHNKVLHEQVVLHVGGDRGDPARSPTEERVSARSWAQGFYQVIAHYGFMETPDVPDVAASEQAGRRQAGIKAIETSFYLGRETLIATPEHPPTALGPRPSAGCPSGGSGSSSS